MLRIEFLKITLLSYLEPKQIVALEKKLITIVKKAKQDFSNISGVISLTESTTDEAEIQETENQVLSIKDRIVSARDQVKGKLDHIRALTTP